MDTPLQTLTLDDAEDGLRASFVPDAGLLCCSLTLDGQELLAQRAGVQAYAELGKTMGIPLLYPWANRLAAPSYTVAGVTVQLPDDRALIGRDAAGLPIHGVVPGRLRWSVESEREDTLLGHLPWTAAEAEPFDAFPFEHELKYRATLGGGALRIDLDVRAGERGPVPLALGFHPYLAPGGVPRAQWQVELPAMRRLELDAQQIPTGAGSRVPAEAFELDGRGYDDGFDEVAGDARFAVTAGTRRMQLDFLEGFDCAQLFAPASAELICFEPMSAPANALRSGRGLRLLAPGEQVRLSFSLSVARSR